MQSFLKRWWSTTSCLASGASAPTWSSSLLSTRSVGSPARSLSTRVYLASRPHTHTPRGRTVSLFLSAILWWSHTISGARQIAWLFTSFSITHSYTHTSAVFICVSEFARDPFHVSIFPKWLMISWCFSSMHIRCVSETSAYQILRREFFSKQELSFRYTEGLYFVMLGHN